MSVTLIATITLMIFVALALSNFMAVAIARAGFPIRKQVEYNTIDGLRGFLALLVMGHHFVIWIQISRLGGDWVAPDVNLFQQIGAGSVALFFMITGFLFYPLVETGWRMGAWRAFLLQRVFRVMPLVIVSFIIITIIVAVRQNTGLDRDFPLAAIKWLSAMSYPPLMGYEESGRINAFVFWTLHYEWIFYIVTLPACALVRDALPARVPSWTIPLTLVMIGAAKMGFFPEKGASFLPLFGIGMLTRVVQFQPSLQRFFQNWAVDLVAFLGLVAALVLFRSPYDTALPLFGLFFIVVASGTGFGPILRSRGAQVLGACSFGVYVLHGIILSLTFTDGADWISRLSINWLIALLPLLTCVVVGLSAILHLTVERPAIAMGAGFVKRWKLR